MSANDEAVSIVRLAGAWSGEVLKQYQEAAKPEELAALARATEAGALRFDFAVRDVTGFAPMLQLIAVAGDIEKVIGSEVLRKRGV